MITQEMQNSHLSTRRLNLASRRSERGATLVEYALVFMLFLGLVFGISAFGHALFVYHHLDHVTKEATRYASVRGATCANDNASGGSCLTTNSASGTAGPTSQADVTAFINNITPQSIDYTQFSITTCGVGNAGTMCAGSTTVSKAANCSTGSGGLPNNPGCLVSVTIQYPYTFVFPLFGAAGSINMSSTSELVILH
jgi:Flp pilus assembly protein TadG